MLVGSQYGIKDQPPQWYQENTSPEIDINLQLTIFFERFIQHPFPQEKKTAPGQQCCDNINNGIPSDMNWFAFIHGTMIGQYLSYQSFAEFDVQHPWQRNHPFHSPPLVDYL